MKKLLLALAIFISSSAVAQVFNIASVEKLNISGNSTCVLTGISPSGDYVLLSGEALDGLTKYDLASGKSDVISTALGAGNGVKISDDGKNIVYREDTFVKGLRKTSVIQCNIATGLKTTLISGARNVNAISARGNVPTIVNNGSLTKLNNVKTASTPAVVSINNRQLVITKNGKTSVLSPNGTQHSYIWPSLSPDGTKVCYFVCGVGCFVSNIDGSNVTALGTLRAAQWYDNNTIVAMRDIDDGHTIIASSIIAKTLDGTEQVLTDNSMIALYPFASAATNKIAFSTIEGETYIINVK